MALTRKQRREFLEQKKKHRFWKDLPLYVILLVILVGFGFLAKWILKWSYVASFLFAALCAEFLFALLAYAIYALAKATKAKTPINPTRCLGFAASGALGAGAILIIKLAAGWSDWAACLIGLPIALIIAGITFLVAKVRDFLGPTSLN